DGAYAKHNNDEGRCGDRNRLSAETRDGAGTPGDEFDHTTPNPDVILKFQNSTGRTVLEPGICREAAGFQAKPRKIRVLGCRNHPLVLADIGPDELARVRQRAPAILEATIPDPPCMDHARPDLQL